MTTLNTKYRSDQIEIMDDFAMEGEVLRDALDKIAVINHFLGGNRLTSDGVKKLIARQPKGTTIRILDIGCGNGDMLRHLGRMGEKEGFTFDLNGIDANAFTISHAQKLSNGYAIQYECRDIFSESFKNVTYDIVLCTLTLHHFKDDEIQALLDILYKNTRLGIVINDLHRSKTAYLLFKMLGFVMRLNSMSTQDGLVSILRGFKKADLVRFSEKSNFKKYSIQWKWAFRYQWIIYKI